MHLTLASRALSVFLSPAGDSGLLTRIPNLLPSNQTEREGPAILLLPILLQISLSIIIRYTLGHILTTLLILETAHLQNAQDPAVHPNKPPLLRNLRPALHHLYQTDGIWFLTRGLKSGLQYRISHYLLRDTLQTFLFGENMLLAPVTYAVSSMLLGTVHLRWTCATILKDKHKYNSFGTMTETKGRWGYIAAPAFMYGLVQGCMGQLSGLTSGLGMVDATGSSFGVDVGMDVLVGAEVMTAVAMFGLRFLALLPMAIGLVLVEVSLLAGAEETVVPALGKGRRKGATVAEVLGGWRVPLGVRGVWGSRKLFNGSVVLGLVVLHVKKCLVEVVVEGVCCCWIGMIR